MCILCRLCFNDEIINGLEQKERSVQFEEERNKRIEKENAEKQRKLEERRQAHKDSLVTDLDKHADNWFNHKKLLRYSDELENYLITCKEKETVRLLQQYIRLVRENAEKINPIGCIVKVMYEIQSFEDNQ